MRLHTFCFKGFNIKITIMLCFIYTTYSPVYEIVLFKTNIFKLEDFYILSFDRYWQLWEKLLLTWTYSCCIE